MDYAAYLYISLPVDHLSGHYPHTDLYLDPKSSADRRSPGYIEDIDGACRYETDIKGSRPVTFM